MSGSALVRFKENGASHVMEIEVDVVDLSSKASFLTDFNEPMKETLRALYHILF